MTSKLPCINCGIKVEENPEEMIARMKLYCLNLLVRAIKAKARDRRPLTARRKAKVVTEADVVVVVLTVAMMVAMTTKDKAI
jgi:hypothetical protein